MIAFLLLLLPLSQTPSADRSLQALPVSERLDRFKAEKVFWRQFEIGQALADATTVESSPIWKCG